MEAGAALYRPGVTAEKASAWGFTVDDYKRPPVEIWPDNWLPLKIFDAVGTQWRMGMGGPSGLDYNALREVMRIMRVPADKRLRMFQDIRILEMAALEVMHQEQ